MTPDEFKRWQEDRGNVVPLLLHKVPRREAAVSAIRSGSHLDDLLKRAVSAYAERHGADVALVALEREVIKLQQKRALGG